MRLLSPTTSCSLSPGDRRKSNLCVCTQCNALFLFMINSFLGSADYDLLIRRVVDMQIAALGWEGSRLLVGWLVSFSFVV